MEERKRQGREMGSRDEPEGDEVVGGRPKDERAGSRVGGGQQENNRRREGKIEKREPVYG